MFTQVRVEGAYSKDAAALHQSFLGNLSSDSVVTSKLIYAQISAAATSRMEIFEH